MKRFLLLVLVICFVLSMSTTVWAWGAKELENEKIAVNFAREVERGGYKIVNTQELKKWIDEKSQCS